MAVGSHRQNSNVFLSLGLGCPGATYFIFKQLGAIEKCSFSPKSCLFNSLVIFFFYRAQLAESQRLTLDLQERVRIMEEQQKKSEKGTCWCLAKQINSTTFPSISDSYHIIVDY